MNVTWAGLAQQQGIRLVSKKMLVWSCVSSPLLKRVVVCGHRLVTVSLTINATLKCLSSLPILMQASFWWWQYSVRYCLPLPIPPGISVPASMCQQGVRVFSWKLPPALLAEWPGSFTCYCGNTGGGTDTEIRVSTESWLRRRKFSCCSCRDLNPWPFNHESGALTTELSHSPRRKHPTDETVDLPVQQAVQSFSPWWQSRLPRKLTVLRILETLSWTVDNRPAAGAIASRIRLTGCNGLWCCYCHLLLQAIDAVVYQLAAPTIRLGQQQEKQMTTGNKRTKQWTRHKVQFH